MKFMSLKQVSSYVKNARSEGQTVGLITGCFDLIHIGHINLFRYAKRRVDVLIVGVETDVSIKKSKGQSRPINKLSHRCGVLSAISTIDIVFPLKFAQSFNQINSSNKYLSLTRIIKPDFLITNIKTDKYWMEKKSRAKKLGISFLGQKMASPTSTTKLIEEYL